MTTLLLGQDTFHWGYETHHKNQDHFPQSSLLTRWLQPPMPFQGRRQHSSEKRIMTMCLILDRLLIAVRLTPVATSESSPDSSSTTGTDETTDTASNETSGSSSSSDGSTESDSAPSTPPSPRRTSTPCTEEAMSAKVPSGPPSPSLADSSLEVRQILRDQAGHALTRSQYQKQTNAAKQRATVLKRVAQLDINQLPLPKPGEPQPGPSGESNGASRCVPSKQKDSTATSSDKEEWPPPRRKKSQGPKRHWNRETRSFQEERGRNTHTNCKKPNSVLKWLELPPSWETARRQHLSGPLRTIQDTSAGIPV